MQRLISHHGSSHGCGIGKTGASNFTDLWFLTAEITQSWHFPDGQRTDASSYNQQLTHLWIPQHAARNARDVLISAEWVNERTAKFLTGSLSPVQQRKAGTRKHFQEMLLAHAPHLRETLEKLRYFSVPNLLSLANVVMII